MIKNKITKDRSLQLADTLWTIANSRLSLNPKNVRLSRNQISDDAVQFRRLEVFHFCVARALNLMTLNYVIKTLKILKHKPQVRK